MLLHTHYTYLHTCLPSSSSSVSCLLGKELRCQSFALLRYTRSFPILCFPGWLTLCCVFSSSSSSGSGSGNQNISFELWPVSAATVVSLLSSVGLIRRRKADRTATTFQRPINLIYVIADIIIYILCIATTVWPRIDSRVPPFSVSCILRNFNDPPR